MVAWIASILSIIGVLLNAKKIIWCWYFWTLGSLLWIYDSFWRNEKVLWAQGLLWIVFTCTNIYGWYNWHKDKEVLHERAI